VGALPNGQAQHGGKQLFFGGLHLFSVAAVASRCTLRGELRWPPLPMLAQRSPSGARRAGPQTGVRG
jgi:hypothetical protein